MAAAAATAAVGLDVTYVYLRIKPKVGSAKEVITYENFVTSILKKSGDINGTDYDSITNLEKEIETQKSRNNYTIVEKFLHEFPKSESYYHKGYLNYLLNCWLNDIGIEIRPTYIFNIFLHQLCEIINSEPEKYRAIFTKSPEKIQIAIGPTFDIKGLMNMLKHHIPFDLDKFVPTFPNAPENFMDSMYGLFAEMVQSYYSCLIYGCSIPKIRLCTDIKQWQILDNALTNIQNIFSTRAIKLDYLSIYQTKLREMIANLTNKEYWQQFFYLIKCGSASQTEVKGHVIELLNNKSTILRGSLPNMISRFEFTNTAYSPVEQKQFFVSGIMSSSLDEVDIAIPQYSCNIAILDQKKCALTESEISDRKEILNCLTILKIYNADGDYSNFNNHIIIKPDESYDGKVDITLDDDILDQDSLQHNKCVVESKGNKDKYYELMNQARKERLKKDYCFWYLNQQDIESYYKNSITLNREEWLRLLAEHKNHEEVLIASMPKLNLFMKSATNRENYELLIKMANPNVIQAFINEYKKEPYLIKQSGGWSITDPIRSTSEVNTPETLVVDILMELFKIRLPQEIKIDIIKKIVLYNSPDKILNEFIICIHNRIKNGSRPSISPENIVTLLKKIINKSFTKDTECYFSSSLNKDFENARIIASTSGIIFDEARILSSVDH
ncbi:MAG: protein of unknown function DUF4419 [Harvfovirus sp.]|uniref:Uncharacterized protein n=1 Tax=Harvfovirus sp. TaxID=2487768 RepID=A0A3G5A7E9_9VIRU|nr:MAG: protein of unknown function DUF4419 [Harvfovirus sp.]